MSNRQVFIQNSYDKSLSIQIITGIEVCICTNGMTMGQVEDEIRRKQTKNIDEDIYKIVYGGIDKMLGNFLAQDQRVKQLQNTEMTNRMADHIIMDCMRAGVINPAGVKDVWDKWDTPNYAEYKDRNAWSLANAFTERGRGRNIFGRHGANTRMLDIIDSYTNNASRPSHRMTRVFNLCTLPMPCQSRLTSKPFSLTAPPFSAPQSHTPPVASWVYACW